MRFLFWLGLLHAFACEGRVGAGAHATAQGLSGGGLYKVTTVDGGLCSGTGRKTDPLDCHLVADGVTITGDGTAASKLTATVAVENMSFGVFGDGFDGDVTISVDTSLSRDMLYDDLTIDSGVVLNPNGFRVWVKNVLTLNGKIARNGGNGANGNDGSNAVASCTAAVGGTANGGNVLVTSLVGATSAASPTSTPSASSSSTAGFCTTNGTTLHGASSTGVGNNGQNAPAGSCRGGGAGSGGGFVGTASVAAGATGGMTARGAADGNVHSLFPAINSRTDTGQVWSLGTGGGAGSCGRDTTSATEQEPGGGAGGGTGGYIVLLARKIVQGGSGGIEAKGGNGGNGGSCGTHTGNAGGGGAGGGGAGGFVVLVYNTGNPTITVAGGVGGTGGTACTGGQRGGNGGNADAGVQIVHKLGL